MYLFREDLTEEVLSSRERDRYLISEISPSALIDATFALRGKAELEFPILFHLRRGRSLQDWEKLLPQQVSQLFEEFLRLRRLCNREEFITGVSGPAVYEEWRGSMEVAEFEEYLDHMQSDLDATVLAGGCILMT